MTATDILRRSWHALPFEIRCRLADRVTALPVLGPLLRAAHQARIVTERARFVRAQVWDGSGTSAYTLRASGQRVYLRTGSSDAEILNEVFGTRVYEPPDFLQTFLLGRQPLRILDLGAHIGLFGIWSRYRYPHCRITALEPDPDNLEVLSRAVAAAGATPPAWTIVPACAASSDGTASFWGGRGAASAKATAGEGSLRVRQVDVFALFAETDLAKIDIEGGEWEILTDARMASAGPAVLCLEVHRRRSGDDSYVEAASSLLDAAGYQHQAIPASPPGAAMMWAWRGSAAGEARA